jgi:hypothetical protein
MDMLFVYIHCVAVSSVFGDCGSEALLPAVCKDACVYICVDVLSVLEGCDESWYCSPQSR